MNKASVGQGRGENLVRFRGGRSGYEAVSLITMWLTYQIL